MAHDDEERAQRGASPDSVFAAYLARVDAGEALDFDVWVRGHGEMADELRALRQSWSAFTLEVERAASLFHRPRPDEGRGDLTPQFDLRAGTRLGDFELVRVLGQGGMGQVWEAEELPLHRRVAFKVLPASVVASTRVSRRFQREAEAGARLNHPNIVAVHAFGEIDGLPYIVQELVPDGATLADFLAEMRQEPALPADYCERAARLAAKLADALQAAHERGVIHRDVKPQNVLINTDDEPKISDFGLARLQDLTPLSLTGEVIGTYCYMSPEQARRQGLTLDGRTDVFSLGATFYEMLTFRRAFPGDSGHEIVEKILQEEPVDPREVRNGIPTELALICAKAMEKRREDRYPTMAAFAADLRRFLNHEPILASPASPLRRLGKWSRRHPGRLFTVLLATVLISALGLMGYRASLAARTRRTIERNNHYLQAELAIQTGDLDDALAQVRAAHRRLGPDPAGHLMLAGAYASRGRFPESEEQVALAERAGFSVESPDKPTAEALYHRGLWLFSKYRELGPEASLEAVSLFEEAVERSPRLYAALYPLYKLRRSFGDTTGAKEALEAYQSWLVPRGDFYRVIEAQRLELEGEFARAAEILEALLANPDVGEERARDLRVRRSLGQVYLQLGRPEAAREQLEIAIAESPSDSPSLANLAICHYELARAAMGFDELHVHTEALERHANRARELDASMEDAYRLPALAALLCIERQLGWALDIPREDWDRAGSAMERLRAFAPGDQAVDQLGAHIAFLRAQATPEPGARLAELERCLALHPEHVDANIMYGQSVLAPDRLEDALEAFRAARDGCKDSAATGELWFSLQWEPALLLAAHVWIFHVAGLLGLEDQALEAKDSALIEIESADRERSKNDLLTFAEFLATAPSPSLIDCELALDMVWRFELKSAFEGTPLAEAASEIIARIESSCP